MDDERLRTSADALRFLGAEIRDRRRELATLERAFDTLDAAITGGNLECDKRTERSPCAGSIYVDPCRACGIVIRRCQAHGGPRAIALAARWHRHQEHGYDPPNRSSSDDEGGVSRGGETMPMGRVPTPLATRDNASGGARRERPDDADEQEAKPQTPPTDAR